MEDVQNQTDHRNIPIDKVGVKDIRHPITVLDRANGVQKTVASINMYVNLPHHYKGTHMSRFIEVLSDYSDNINLRNLKDILEAMKKRLNAHSAHIEVDFPYFIKKTAPVSGARSLLEYNIAYRGSINGSGLDLVVEVKVPVTTLCPCSQMISDQGAHNQRGVVNVAVRFKEFIWIEDIIRLVEESASCEVFSLLKRQDEKYVTEKAYGNPMFVEDVVREVSGKLDKVPEIIWFTVESENFESIHNHSAYAYVEKDKRK
ncbi:GTP cyclohydrolase FolE2 [Dethiosulfatarculus sandiegensis]|uniref:GTP cyclohydrolase FolE2 n=1 Tax=Dethiosulfatarculus sandiegensis TaxID=1429043 RepID=A0A0D2J0U8_9BACT|nr:GTP cyclohydrolase FolE2 [Dethiosulfatarculus sandiegensis]KIX11874.1 GTP cyclohydrolase [Dethiosulfatarculus sandiegensis]